MARYTFSMDLDREPWLFPVQTTVTVDIAVTPDDSEYVIDIRSVDGDHGIEDVSALDEGEIELVHLAAQRLYERDEKANTKNEPRGAA